MEIRVTNCWIYDINVDPYSGSDQRTRGVHYRSYEGWVLGDDLNERRGLSTGITTFLLEE